MSNSLCKNQIPISAYQDPAFFISMLMNEPGYERLLYSSYIGLSWNPNDENKLNIDMDYGDMYNYYDVETIGIKNTWHLLSFDNPYAFFIKFISEKIRSGYYVTGMFDEYYISQKARYHKTHYKGQFYLVDVNELDKTFYAVGTDIGKPFGEYDIPFDELEMSIDDSSESVFDKSDYSNVFNFVKSKNSEYVFSLPKVYESVKTLLNTSRDYNNICGFDAVRYFLDNIITEYKREYAVLICEHAKLMCRRLKYIADNNIVENYSCDYSIIQEITDISDKHIKSEESLSVIKTDIDCIINKETALLNELCIRIEEEFCEH